MDSNNLEQLSNEQRSSDDQSRLEDLTAYEAELDAKVAFIASASAELDGKKADLDKREATLHSLEKEVREAKRDLAAQKVRIEDDESEIERQLADIEARETLLADKNKTLAERLQSVHEREMALKVAALDAQQVQSDAHRGLETELMEARSKAYAEIEEKRRQESSQLEKDLARRRAEAEEEIAQREKEAREVIDRLYHDAEAQRKKDYSALNRELADMRKEATVEHDKLIADAKAEIIAMRNAQQKDLDEQSSQIAAKEAELKEREQTLKDDRDEVEKASARNFREQKRQDKKEDELEARETQLKEDVREMSLDIIRNYESRISAKDSALEQLRSRLAQLEAEKSVVEDFKQIYGDSPTLISSQITQLKKDKEELEKRLVTSPSKAVQEERDQLRDECTRIRTENQGLQQKVSSLLESQRNMDRVQAENTRLQDQIQDMEFRIRSLQGYYDAARAEIQRLSSEQSRLAERDERLKVIQTGGVEPLHGPENDRNISECEWLDNIWKNCKDFGMVFPRRILYAFHTALKISDWSMITVLSGVSGTGKSELPKLYAAFGGMNFINVPVQPSWDSQESMLGFFNSIDNRFEPEPLLRFLYKCTEDPQFNRYMSIVLLDEMNLAHVEHYFADFLSKLETRRSADKSTLPKVEVKLGAGVEPYYLELKRSILWTGTMNQDETTKSLSDKVLDRGLVLYFPRPTHLTDRKRMISLNEAVSKSHRTLMTTGAWSSWITRDLNKDENTGKDSIGDAARSRMDHYRSIVERINTELEGTGRALGHRVWQAIEFYILNYPTVRKAIHENKDQLTPELHKAMDIAFEDQLVQKVMPKLRGIETRGEGGQHLCAIEDLLEEEGFESLKDDFDLAMDLGYGQFIWSSAKYIQEDEESDDIDTDLTEDIETSENDC